MSLIERFKAEEEQKRLEPERIQKQYAYLCPLAEALLAKEGQKVSEFSYLYRNNALRANVHGTVCNPHLTISEKIAAEKPTKVLDIMFTVRNSWDGFENEYGYLMMAGDILYSASRYDNGHIQVTKISPGTWINDLEKICRKKHIKPEAKPK